MTKLPFNCTRSEINVYPKNWDKPDASTLIDWYIHYRFYDPASKSRHKSGYLKIIKTGINREKNLEERRWVIRQFIAYEIKRLNEGFNPITRTSSNSIAFEVSPNTPFIKALWKAVEKRNVVAAVKIDEKSILKGIEAASTALGIGDMPVSQITRKYIKVILEKCSQLNPRWSPRRHNAYRTTLIGLFSELIEMEAVDINPVRDIKKMAELRKERLLLTLEERKKIDEILHRDHYPFWRVIQMFFHSGSREIEILNVKGKGVDLKNQS